MILSNKKIYFCCFTISESWQIPVWHFLSPCKLYTKPCYAIASSSDFPLCSQRWLLRMIWTQYIDIIFRCAHNLEQRYYKSPTLVASIIIHCVTMGSRIRLLFVFILLISVAFAYWPEQEPEKCIESGGTVSYKIIFVFEKSQLFISYNFQCAVFNMVKCCQPLNCYVTKSIKYGECGWSTTVPVLLVDISLYWIEFEIEIQFPSHRYPFNIVLFRVCVCVYFESVLLHMKK